MNKCIAISLLGVSLVSAHLDAKESAQSKVLDAIEVSDLGLVKKLLRRIDTLTEKDKKQLLEAAHDAVDEREQSVKLLKSPRDLAKAVGGTCLTVLGAVLVSGGVWQARRSDFEGATALGCVGFAALTGGLYLAFKGVKCSIALGYVEDAEKIEELVEKSGAPSKESPSSPTPSTT